MTELRKAAEQALETLEEINKLSVGEKAVCLPAEIDGAMEALRQALAETDHFRDATKKIEPVAWHEPGSFGHVTIVKKWALENGWEPLYTAPPIIEAAVLAEREACAKVCDEREKPNLYGVRECAAAIRARGNHD